MLITQNLSPETIVLASQVQTADEVIELLSAKLAPVLAVEQGVIKRAIISRERARTTAFPNGAAIPHCRLPGLRRFGCALLILQKPVRWDHEGHAVDTVLMIVGPSESVSDHLRILANSSQILDSPAIRTRLKASPDSPRAYELIAAAEDAIERRRQETGMLRELRDRPAGRACDYLAEIANRFEW